MKPSRSPAVVTTTSTTNTNITNNKNNDLIGSISRGGSSPTNALTKLYYYIKSSRFRLKMIYTIN